ncbi:MAG TPA: trypsin-like peptidase domain-containing protein [Candidatus Dormibacteraeota bacterium]|nr:trypsin-like peptidase domain-containing protein [Candidatus Dormibacteraeota bacterium]
MPALIIGLVGAIVGSFAMMLYASTHFSGVAGPNNAPPPVSAAPLTGVSDQDRIVSAVKRTKASVVAIQVEINGQQYVPVDPLMQQFFGNQGPGVVQPFHGRASGSGFVYDAQGDIVTNAHVVTAPQGGRITRLTVVFANGDKVPAHVIATNIDADIAIVKVDRYGKLPPPLQLGDSDRLEQGQWAIAIGEPLELQQTVTVGVVSGFDRDEQIPTEGGGTAIAFKGLLQTSAPINPGNSGGPLIDINGRVIGINQSTVRSAFAQGIGFAIPSNTVRRVVAQLEAHPGIHQGTGQGFVGVVLENLNAGLRNQIGYSGTAGVAIVQVVGGSPADQAGLQPGDVVVSADGRGFSSNSALSHYIASRRPGQDLRLDVWSQGDRKLVVVKLAERPAAQPIQQP